MSGDMQQSTQARQRTHGSSAVKVVCIAQQDEVLRRLSHRREKSGSEPLGGREGARRHAGRYSAMEAPQGPPVDPLGTPLGSL